ncbi:hypothetical protein AB0L59_10910 [Streptomyces sp. NPDC052109]|uniref:hypothetical protein n=1 Tax=Streptomyces sp. NPDC052109 TaxID=3155527 RepID=UPI0034449601
MAMNDVIAASERLAQRITDGRLSDEAFEVWVNEGCSVWGVDRDDLLAQVEAVALIALITTALDTGAGTDETEWRAKALAKLRSQDDVELFAALPRPLPAKLVTRVEQLRLVSAGLTSGSAARWLRLVDTASEFLGDGPPPRD